MKWIEFSELMEVVCGYTKRGWSFWSCDRKLVIHHKEFGTWHAYSIEAVIDFLDKRYGFDGSGIIVKYNNDKEIE